MTETHTATIHQLPIKTRLKCSQCGADGEGTCQCGATYVPAGARAAEAVAANPRKSDRAIAEETGVSDWTVRHARKKSGARDHAPEKRTGKDGKSYPAARKLPARKPIKKTSGDDAAPVESAFPIYGSCAGGRVVTQSPAQQKLEAATRRIRRELEAELAEQRADLVREFDQLRLDLVTTHNERQAEYDAVISSRKGVMTRKTFDAIRRCLHPDSRQSVSDERLAEAFRLFSRLELKLLPESDFPTRRFKPLNAADLLKAKMRRDDARRVVGSDVRANPVEHIVHQVRALTGDQRAELFTALKVEWPPEHEAAK